MVSYLLVIFYQSDYRNYSGIVTIIRNRLGDVGIIISIFVILNRGSLDFFRFNKTNNIINLFIILLIIRIFTKRAQFPFSS